MRILQINVVCGIGSTGRVAADLQQILIDKGHDCKIAYGRGNVPVGVDVIKIGNNLDNYLHVLKTRLWDKHGLGSTKATKILIESIKTYNPDIIHLHNIHGYYLNIELLFDFIKTSNKPIVWTLHDCWPFTGHCSHFDYVGCTKWKSSCYDCEQRGEYPAAYFCDRSRQNFIQKKKLFTSCSRITFVSPTNWLSGLLQESFLNRFSQVVIPSGIDLNQFKPTESNLRKLHGLEDKFIVLGVSNGFHKFKGFQYFIELANTIPEQFQLIIIGVKDNQRNLFPPNVIMLPHTNSITELAQYYTVADVFVNPSLQETQGLTNIEALACGTPVVAFNSGGIPECIDSRSGIIVERGDSKALIEAVKRVCMERFEREDCILNAARFNKFDIYVKYIELYKRLFDKMSDDN